MNDYIEGIIKIYMQQIFYFSVKKTSGVYEVEDLTQEIIFEIIKALSGGSTPNDTKAWVWKIARNRYARWAKRQKQTHAVCDIDELSDVIGDGSAVEDGIIEREEHMLLRRELSLLAREYRTIVCEYYLNNRSLADIALSLGLPLGTVKHKDGSEWALVGMMKTDKAPKYLEVWGNDVYDQIIMLGNRTNDLSIDMDNSQIPHFSRPVFDKLFDTSYNGEITALLTECYNTETNILRNDIPKVTPHNV